MTNRVGLLFLFFLVSFVRADLEEIVAIGSTGHFFDDEFHVVGGTNGYDWFGEHLSFFPDDQSEGGNWTLFPEELENLLVNRTFHSSVLYRGALFVVGGDSDGIEVQSLQNSDHTLYEVEGPCRRKGQAVIQYDNSLYLFGGKDENDFHLSDLWRADLDPEDIAWTQLQSNWDSPVPGRAFHSAVLYQDSIYIFGGETEDGFANDVWRYDILRNWWVRCVITVDGDIPTPRGGHVATYWIDENMYVWGGFNEDDGYLDDMWRFNFQEEEWEEVDQGEWIPTARTHAAYDIRHDALLLTGGQTSTGNQSHYWWNPLYDPSFRHLGHQPDYAADFWSFNFTSQTWSLLGCRLTDDGEVICESNHQAECLNDCSGNGVCAEDGYCICFSEWKGEDCSENVCETHLGYHVEMMDRILMAETLLKLSKRLALLKAKLTYVEEHLPEWEELTSCLKLSDRPQELVQYIEAAASLQAWANDGVHYVGGLYFHQNGMEAELLPTLEEFNLVLENGLEHYDYLSSDDTAYGNNGWDW